MVVDDLGGGFKYFQFSPRKIGEMIQFEEHIFQLGWFNHQLDNPLKKAWSISLGGKAWQWRGWGVTEDRTLADAQWLLFASLSTEGRATTL